MPIFDVITIHEKHLAKVRTVRSEGEIRRIVSIGKIQSIAYPKPITFINWYKYIHTQPKKKRNTINLTIKHTFT